MSLISETAAEIFEAIECRPMAEDEENWNRCPAAIDREE